MPPRPGVSTGKTSAIGGGDAFKPGHSKGFSDPSTPSESKAVAQSRGKMAFRLDDGNLDILGQSLDLEQLLDRLAARIGGPGRVGVDEFYQLAREHLTTPQSYTFSSVGKRIWPLFESEPGSTQPSLDLMYRDKSYAASCNKAGSPQRRALDTATLRIVYDHFHVANEAGSRVVIDSFLCAAISLAQQQIQKAPALAHKLLEAIGREDLHTPLWFIAVPEQDLSIDSVSDHRSWSLRGAADYVLSVTSEESRDMLQSTNLDLKRKVAAMLTVVEAKGPGTLSQGQDQVLAEAVALLTRTRRKTVVMVLTNAQTWEFFVVSKSPNDKLFSCKCTNSMTPFRNGSEGSLGEAGFIVQLLINAILHPADEFEARLCGDKPTGSSSKV